MNFLVWYSEMFLVTFHCNQFYNILNITCEYIIKLKLVHLLSISDL